MPKINLLGRLLGAKSLPGKIAPELCILNRIFLMKLLRLQKAVCEVNYRCQALAVGSLSPGTDPLDVRYRLVSGLSSAPVWAPWMGSVPMGSSLALPGSVAKPSLAAAGSAHRSQSCGTTLALLLPRTSDFLVQILKTSVHPQLQCTTSLAAALPRWNCVLSLDLPFLVLVFS